MASGSGGTSADTMATPHTRGRVGMALEDIAREEMATREAEGGLVEMVNRRGAYYDPTEKWISEVMDRTILDRGSDPHNLSTLEKNAVRNFPTIIEMTERGDEGVDDMVRDMEERLLAEKGLRIRDKEATGGNRRIEPFTIQECPSLDCFSASNGVKYYTWKKNTLIQLRGQNLKSTIACDLLREKIDRKHHRFIMTCRTPIEIFRVMDRRAANKELILRDLDNKIARGCGQSEHRSDEQLIEKIDKIQTTIGEVADVDARYDLQESTVRACLLTFGDLIGSKLEFQGRIDQWAKEKTQDQVFLSHNLEMYLEKVKMTVGHDAMTKNTRWPWAAKAKQSSHQKRFVETGVKENPRHQSKSKQGKSDAQNTKEAQMSVAKKFDQQWNKGATNKSRGRVDGSSRDNQGSRSRPSTGQTQKLQCFWCKKDHRLEDCPVVVGLREGVTNTHPPGMCKICLCPKDNGKTHRLSRKDGCNIRRAPAQERQNRGNPDLKMDVACEHGRHCMSCNQCYKSNKGKQPNSLPQFSFLNRFSMNQYRGNQCEETEVESVRLPFTIAAREKVIVKDPKTGFQVQCLLTYDSGGGHSVAEESLAKFDHNPIRRYARNVQVVGANSTATKTFEVVDLQIGNESGNSQYMITVNIRDMSFEQPDPPIDTKELSSGRVREDVTSEEAERLPTILLGLDVIHLHPDAVRDDEIPQAIKERYPGLAWRKSRITGVYIPLGNTTRSTQSSKSLARKFVDDQGNDDHIMSQIGEPAEPSLKKQKLEEVDEGNFCAPISMMSQILALHHDNIKRELQDLFCNPEQSAHMGSIDTLGCLKCHPWPKYILGKREEECFMGSQLYWEPHNSSTKIGKGQFVLNRTLDKKARFFPSGKESVTNNFLRLERKLAKSPATRQFLNFNMEQEWRAGQYRKISEAELAQELMESKVVPATGIWIDVSFTYNVKSQSTPARLLVDPARKRYLLDHKGCLMSYNELIANPRYPLITPLEFGIRQTLSPLILGMDVAKAFRAIKLSQTTQLQNLTIFYEGEQGQPLISREGAKIVNGQPKLATYAFVTQLFGETDSPSVLGLSLKRAVQKWQKHETAAEQAKVRPEVLADVQETLRLPYVDDLLPGVPVHRVLNHLMLRCEACNWCEECRNKTLNIEASHQSKCPLYGREQLMKVEE